MKAQTQRFDKNRIKKTGKNKNKKSSLSEISQTKTRGSIQRLSIDSPFLSNH